MAKNGKRNELTTLAAAGRWVWANRDRIRAALQSEPVQEALKSPKAQRVLAHPNLRRVLEHPEVRSVLRDPEVQRWINGIIPATPPETATTVISGQYEPYTGETRRLDKSGG